MTLPRLDELLKSNTEKFEIKKSLLVFKSLHFRATGEKVIEGFRYFSCELSQLLPAFEARDFATIASLPFAEDEDGDPDTSAVLLDLAYTDSGAFIAAQPVEYRDHFPTAVAPAVILEGAPAKSLIQIIKGLDQSA
jgi:hypothetical protein